MPSQPKPLLRILFLAANPSNTSRIYLDQEAREIHRAIAASPHGDRITIDPCWAATIEDLQRALLERAPQVLHISAHGDPDSITLAGAGGSHSFAALGGVATLLGLVNRETPRVRVVVLNSCHSAAQLDLLCAHVDCAVGMAAPIDDNAAIAFSAAFYHALGIGYSVADAFHAAQARLEMEYRQQAHVPQLRARPGVDLSALTLLPPAGAPPEAPREVEVSGRWLPGHGLKSGDTLAEGRFLLHEWIGQGAVATVWRATDRRNNTEVALKILHERCVGDTALMDRFFRGARLMSQFQHPTVVRVLEPYCAWHGYRFFVMEFVRGRTLMDYALANRLSWRAVIGYGIEVGNALAYAHERSCIHRDVKPSNILVDERGQARLFDFDLVRDRYFEGGTRSGAMGTFAYASPEVLEQPQNADGRCDLYSLAMTLICTMTGRDPHRDEKRDPGQLIRSLPCPPELQSVLARAVAWETDQRHGSMLAFIAAMQDAIAAYERRTRRGGALRRGLAWVGAGLVGALVLGTLAHWSLSGAPSPPANVAGAAALPLSASPPAPRSTVETDRSGSGDAHLDAALRVDHSQAIHAIRLTADNTLAEAREHARGILGASRFQPWIVHENFGKRLYYVFVGDYSTRQAAEADRPEARAIRNEGAMIRLLHEDCPSLRFNPAGYHDCDRF